jgi:hypothetical protein
MKEGGISIWFLIGLIISVYGAIITAAGIYQYFYPPTPALALADAHAGIWWGLFMLIVGIFYVVKFRPRG